MQLNKKNRDNERTKTISFTCYLTHQTHTLSLFILVALLFFFLSLSFSLSFSLTRSLVMVIIQP